MRKEESIKNLIFVTKGSFKIYDDRMILRNEFTSGQIFGLDLFVKLYQLKYKIDLND